ncbi:RNA-directed DNA polymerase, eukaryota, reverse transcriptase zinc-binding domain protein [Tanacetum coccineum]
MMKLGDKSDETCEEVESENVSLNRGIKVNVTNNDKEDEDLLMLIPTEVGMDGTEVVIFDDEIVKEGSKKWELIVCGYFMGYKMSYQELRYNLYRMWGKFGLKHIFPHGNGVFLFKFKNENGINDVIKNGPWMVNGKPMFVQKWDPTVCLEKAEPTKLPLWVKFKNLPLEAWNTKGISAIASRLGNPLIMDQVTTHMCNMGNGRAGYARVLIEVEAGKGLPDQIEIVYRNSDNMEIGRKFIKVEYDWKLPMCSFCLVFGHKDDKCGCRPKTVEELKSNREEARKEEEAKRKSKEEEFVQVNRKKQFGRNAGNKQGTKKNNVTYEPVNKEKVNVDKEKVNAKGSMGSSSNVQNADNGKKVESGSPNTRNKWKVNNEVIDSIKRSANKFSVLIDDPGDEGTNDDFNEVHDEEDDVFVDLNSFASKIASWNISGLGKLSKQNAIRNLMNDEKLSICAILETRLKGPKVKRIGDKVFGRWSWCDNAHFCVRGCRIMVRLLCTFIHVETVGRLRKQLSADLSNYKTICNNNPWVIMGDLNIDDVASTRLQYTWTRSLLNPNSSILKKIDRVMDKEEFKSIVEEKWNIEVEDFAMFKLVKRLKAMKPIINNLNWKNRNLSDKVKKLKKDIDEIQRCIDKDPQNKTLRKQGVAILGEYFVALEDEEKLMFQRAKVQWFNNGDRNSAFHKVIKRRVNRSRVDEIWGTNNVRYDGDQVPTQFSNHFMSFLGPQKDKKCLDLDAKIFKNKIDQQDACDMIRKVSKDEIKEAMFSIDDNKAPRPNGYTAKFYKKSMELYWWRSYKRISKILTNKIKSVLDSIVDKNQSAFFPERQITDNILLTQEPLKGYDCAKGPKRCSMKIDIQKSL